jgi:hypothetical protein
MDAPLMVMHAPDSPEQEWAVTIGMRDYVDFFPTKSGAVAFAKKEARKMGRPGVVVQKMHHGGDLFDRFISNDEYWSQRMWEH